MRILPWWNLLMSPWCGDGYEGICVPMCYICCVILCIVEYNYIYLCQQSVSINNIQGCCLHSGGRYSRLYPFWYYREECSSVALSSSFIVIDINFQSITNQFPDILDTSMVCTPSPASDDLFWFWLLVKYLLIHLIVAMMLFYFFNSCVCAQSCKEMKKFQSKLFDHYNCACLTHFLIFLVIF